jgi:hypothetical protein
MSMRSIVCIIEEEEEEESEFDRVVEGSVMLCLHEL